MQLRELKDHAVRLTAAVRNLAIALCLLAALAPWPAGAQTQSDGSVSVAGGSALPGATFDIRVTLSLNAGVKVDALSFGVKVTPNGSAPALGSQLSFTPGTGLPDPSLVDASTGPIAVAWLLPPINPPLSGTVALGSVRMAVPASAQSGQTYTLQVTGANGSLTSESGTTSVPLSAGPAATLTVGSTGTPTIALSAGSLTFTATQGGASPAAQTVSLDNAGSGTLSWTAFASTLSGGNWLSVTPGSGTGAAALAISVDITGMQAGSYAGGIVISAAGATNSPTTVNVKLDLLPPKPAFTEASITNGASFQAGISAGSIVTIFGKNLLKDVTGIVPATQLPLETQLRGTSVTVNGFPAPLFGIANVNGLEQINLQIPYEVTGQASVSLVVNNNGNLSAPVTATLRQSHPGIFVVDQNASGAILHTDFKLVTASNPALKGGIVLIYATGLGPVSPAPSTGSPAPRSPLANTILTPVVRIGGITAEVSFSGLAPDYVGLYQLNVKVPAAAATGNLDVIIEMEGQLSNVAKLAVQ